MKNIVKYGICLFCMLLSAAAFADDFDTELELPEEEYSAPAPTFLGGFTDKLCKLVSYERIGRLAQRLSRYRTRKEEPRSGNTVENRHRAAFPQAETQH